MRCVKAKDSHPRFATAGDGKRVIIHIDMDAFFASVEQIGNPRLSKQPVIVCGDPDTRTVVAAANYVARQYGIRSGMPASTARQRCPQAILIEGNPEKYVYFSLKLKSIFDQFSPLVEVFSIDESFLDVTQTHPRYGGPIELAKRIKAELQNRLSLTGTAGIGPSKLLAKMAAGFEKPDGLSTLWKHELPTKFFPLPVEELFGIGEKTAQKLHALRIKSIDDLRHFPVPVLEKLFGVAGKWMHQAANGLDESPVIPEEENPPPKSVGNGYTLEQDSVDEAFLMKVIYALCCKVGRRLRKDCYGGRTLTLSTRFADYTTITRALTTEEFLYLDKDLLRIAKFIYLTAVRDKVGLDDSSRRPRHTPGSQRRQPIRYLGISVSNLVSFAGPRQLHLFDMTSSEKYERLVRSMDQVRDMWGERALTWASLV